MMRLLFAIVATLLSRVEAEGDSWADFLALTEPLKAEDGVVVLSRAKYSELTNHPAVRFTFVEFYAPWCPHCQKLAPKYAELSELVAADPALEGVFVAKVDVDDDKPMKTMFNVQSFPTLYTIHGPRRVELYTGKRETAQMLAHLRKKIVPNDIFIRFTDRVTNPYAERPAERYIWANIDSIESPEGRLLLKLSESLYPEIKIGINQGTPKDHRLYGKIEIHSGSAVRHIEPPQGVMTDLEPLDFQRLTKWIVTNMAPLVYMFEPGLGEEIFKGSDLNCLVFVRPPPASPSNMEKAKGIVMEDGTQKLVNVEIPVLVDTKIKEAVVTVAKNFTEPRIQHTIVPVGVDEKNSLLSTILERVGLEDVAFPFVVMTKKVRHRFHQGAQVELFPLPLEQPGLSSTFGLEETAELTASNLAQFEKLFLEDSLPKVAKNEDPEASEFVKALPNVESLTADTFEDAVVKSDKDTIVVLYKETCRHCGIATVDNSVEGLMKHSCIDCLFQDLAKIVNKYDHYLDRFESMACSYKNVPTVEFFALNVANNTLSHPTAHGMELYYHWTLSFFVFPANDKQNPRRAPWPGTFLDEWISKSLSLPFDPKLVDEIASDCKPESDEKTVQELANPSEESSKVPVPASMDAKETKETKVDEGKDEL